MNKNLLIMLALIIVVAASCLLFFNQNKNDMKEITIENISKMKDNFDKPLSKDLVEAIYQKDKNLLNELVIQGVDLDVVGKFEYTPIRIAIKIEDVEILKTLLNLGANPNFRAPEGTVAADWAASDEDSAYLRVLLDYGLDPNIKNGNRPIIMTAVENERWEQYEMLVEGGADYLTAKSGDNTTIGLLLASQSEYDRLIEYIKKGGDVETPTKAGLTLIEIISNDQKRFSSNLNSPVVMKRIEVLELLQNIGLSIPKDLPGVTYN